MVKNSKRSTMQFRPSVKPGMEKKDLATPRHSNDTRRRRVARRAAKLPNRFGKVDPFDQEFLNKCAMARSKKSRKMK